MPVPRLSIIIPYLGSASRLEDTLVSVLENRPSACEILVIHDGSYGDRYEICDEVEFIVDDEATSFVDSVNIGIEESDAPIVHLLKPGALVSDGWVEPALNQFDDPHVASVAPLLLQEAQPDTIHTAGVQFGYGGSRKLPLRNQRLSARRPPRATILGPSACAAFYRRDAVEQAGFLPLALGESSADLDLACTLQHLGHRSLLEIGSRVYWRPEDTSRSAFAEGRQLERLFWRQTREFGLMRGLVYHPFTWVKGCLELGPLSVLGRIAALCDVGIYREYRELLADGARDASATLPFQPPADIADRRAAA